MAFEQGGAIGGIALYHCQRGSYPMKYFVIAGEASGDLHAAHLMETVRQEDHEALFVGLGGDKMRSAGCDIRVDYRDMAYMGVVAVLRNLHKVQRNFRIAHHALLTERPDVLILIDYPSFNLRIAQFCKKHLPDTKVVYYIPPKVWAWKAWRVHKIARYSDKMLGIFPFEPAYYKRFGYECQYVGNPTSDCIREWRAMQKTSKNDTFASGDSRPLIAILPGSRPSEIKHCLPTMLEAARKVAKADYQIVVTAAPGIDDAFYTRYLQNEHLTRDTYGCVTQAQAAVVNSGTATLETALLGCPQTAVYYIACSKWLEWLIRPILFKIKHFTLVNIIADKEVIKELVAKKFTATNIEHELTRLLKDKAYRKQMLCGYDEVRDTLGARPAAKTAAKIIVC